MGTARAVTIGLLLLAGCARTTVVCVEEYRTIGMDEVSMDEVFVAPGELSGSWVGECTARHGRYDGFRGPPMELAVTMGDERLEIYESDELFYRSNLDYRAIDPDTGCPARPVGPDDATHVFVATWWADSFDGGPASVGASGGRFESADFAIHISEEQNVEHVFRRDDTGNIVHWRTFLLVLVSFPGEEWGVTEGVTIECDLVR